MSDPLRTDHARPSDDPALADREARIEHLLLAGLDYYFATEYEQAIHVWTRVVFLDRTHDRARAYIERARQALAERQRESEELVHRGVAAFDRGQADTARQLLNEAIARGGPHHVALSVLDRLNRMEAGASADLLPPLPPVSAATPARLAQSSSAAPRRAGASVAVVAAAGMLVVGALFWFQGSHQGWVDALMGPEPAAPVMMPAAPDPLPVPRPPEMTLARARVLYEGGHLRDALRVLESIPPADALRPEADRLWAEVERELLADAVPTPAPPSDAPLAPSAPPVH